MEKEKDIQSNEQGNVATFERNESLLQYEEILEGMSVGIVAFDREWRFRFVNGYTLKVIGKQRKELLGRMLWEVLPDLGSFIETNFRKTMDARVTTSFEVFYAPLRIWVNAHTYPIDDGITVQFIDITESQKAREALAKTKETAEKRAEEAEQGRSILDALIKYAPVELQIIDKNQVILRDSAFSEKLTGHPIEEIEGITIEERNKREPFFHSDELTPARIEELPVIRVLKTGETIINEEWRVKTAKGTLVNVAINTGPIRDRKGTVIGAITTWHDITEIKKAGEALRESEKSFASIFKASPAPIVIIRRTDGAYLEVNKAFETSSGFSRSEVVGKTPKEFSVFADRELRDELLRQVAQKGGVFNREMILKGKGDKKINGLVSIIPVTFREQDCFLFVGIDITDMKRAQKELEQNQAMLDTFIANAPGIIVIIDEQFRHIKINKTAAGVIGKTPHEIEGRRIDEIMPPEIVQSVTADYRKILETGIPTTNQEVTLRFPGRHEPAQVLIHRFLIPLPGGKRGIGVFGIDITARKQAEDALRRNEYELQTIVNNTPDIYFRFNHQLQYTYVNPTFERLTGITKEKFVGKTNDQLGMDRQTVQFWQSAVQEVFDSGKEHKVEYELYGFFGKRYFSARLIPEFEKSGLVGTVLVIARDITELKHVEEEMASLKK